MSNTPDTEEPQDQNIGRLMPRLRRVVVNGRWHIIAALSIVAMGTVIGLAYVPDRYTSEATLLIVQQRIPERYVVPTTRTDVTSVLGAIAEDVLSRARMLAIINELHLYPRQKRYMASEDLVDLMRRNIVMEPLKRNGTPVLDAFKISFTAEQPRAAQDVTNRLTKLFIEQNLKMRSDQAVTTGDFLREQVEAAKQKLLEHEQTLRNFKMDHLGELPEQQQGNLTILSGLHSQLDNVETNMSRARQQRLYLESLLDQYRRMSARSQSTQISLLDAARHDLTRLQTEYEHLLARYTPRHPAVVKAEEEVVRQKALVGQLAAGESHADPAGSPPAPSESDPQTATSIAQLNSQLQANRLEIEGLSHTEAKLKSQMESYESRLNLTPVREQQLTAMLRDYELMKQNYADLLNKELQSQLSSNLEKRQEGQQFRLIDPPNLPEVPSSPNRVKISLVAIGAGLALGIALAWFAGMGDSSFHSEEDLFGQSAEFFVVGVPLVQTPTEQRRRAWRAAIEWAAASALLVIVCLAEMYVVRHRA